MSRAPPSSLHPASLPVGTLVGRWRVVAWAGRGSHGAVYRAVPADNEYAAQVALKLALMPRAPRLAREAELLSRLRNPSIPRLWDEGEWQHPGGDFFPFLAMEWIEGVPLYAWARQQPCSTARACLLLAHLARALQSVHAQGCVHRDVKGDNVLIRRSDGRAMLIDFGTALYPKAETLTPPDAYPGTPAYRSPESALFELQSLRSRSERYLSRPADELYALGVTACRWLTGEYPRFSEPTRDEHGIWRMESVELPAAMEQVEPSLRAQVKRLLSVRPEERGSVEQLAEALEQAARPFPSVAMPAAAPPPPVPSPEVRPPDSARPRRVARPIWPWLATAASALAANWAGWGVLEPLSERTAALSSTPAKPSLHLAATSQAIAQAGTGGGGNRTRRSELLARVIQPGRARLP